MQEMQEWHYLRVSSMLSLADTIVAYFDNQSVFWTDLQQTGRCIYTEKMFCEILTRLKELHDKTTMNNMLCTMS